MTTPESILVTYATRAGSTREVAASIAATLRQTGAEVDLVPVEDVRDIYPYQLVILGSGIRTGSLLPEAVQFAQRFRLGLASIPTAYFVVCLTMKEDTPANRATVHGYLQPLIEIKEPVSTGLFAGVMDHAKLGMLARFFMRHTELGKQLGEGDWRDWDAIQNWALSLVRQPA